MSAGALDGDLIALNAALRAGGRKRLTQGEIWTCYAQACAAQAAGSEPRRALHALLTALERQRAIRLPDPKRWDASLAPPLPTSIELLRDPSTGPSAIQQAWLPVLAFAANERHPATREALAQINAFLLSRPVLVPPVPLRERSLHVFGDEKRLEAFLSAEGLFRGRLPSALIGVVETPMPLANAMQPAARRAPLLILENLHSYDSFRRWNAEAKVFSAVVYGAGNGVAAAAESLRSLADACATAQLLYFGDLDPDGLAILDRIRRQIPAVQPHCNLYRWLLRHGRRAPLDAAPGDARIADWPAALAIEIAALFAAGQRIAQENFGTRELQGMPAVPRDAR